MTPINAFLMAMAAALFIHVASTMRGVTVEAIVLLGIALVFTFNALLSLLEYLAVALPPRYAAFGVDKRHLYP